MGKSSQTASAKKEGKVPFITIAYGLAATFVVFGHSHPLHIEYPDASIEFLYIWHMPLFFFIAGMLIARTSDQRTDIRSWWVRKAEKLLVPYLILSLLAYIPKVILGSLMNDDMSISAGNMIRILLIPREGVWGHFWFIPAYLVLAVLGALLCRGFQFLKMQKAKSLKSVSCCMVVVIGLLLNYHTIPTAWLTLQDISIEFIYLTLGLLLSECIIAYKADRKDVFICVGSVFISLVINHLSDGWWAKFVISILMIFSVVLAAKCMENSWSKIVTYIGEHAFTVYLYSWPLQAVTEIILVVILRCNWYVTWFLMFVVGLGGPLLLVEIYQRFLPRNKMMNALLGVD